MTANVMQELRDQLQAAQLQLGNLSQTQNIINAVRPFPQPAYITCSPYTSALCCVPNTVYTPTAPTVPTVEVLED